MQPDPEFRGRVGKTHKDSIPDWSGPVAPKPGAPNVVVIVLDDMGFSDLGCYGSEISTPRIDRLAARGLRYSNFHVTAMCSPTRACLVTGRNAHSVGVGAIAEWSSGYPAYRGQLSTNAATIAEILSAQGYGTYAIGKWHLTNLGNYTTAGPHDSWPLGRGFSRWYGFLGGFTDQWAPDLHRDNQPIRTPPVPGYHLTGDLIDHAIEHVRDHVADAPRRPFLLYLALGAPHWPHHVPKPFIERCKGRYDAGWDEIRAARLRKQKAEGIVPPDTGLAPRNPGVKAWTDVAADERAVSVRLQETYAAFVEHTDSEIGRLVDYLADVGQLDNTLLVLLSDNGASGEGGPAGAINIRRHTQYEPETTAFALERLEAVGSDDAFNHYPMGWAQVSNTPLKWYKKNTYGGGIRAPLIVHWPKRIAGGGAVRGQYHHVIDVLPTVLEELGIAAPGSYRGIEQIPLHGESFAYTFDQPDAPTRKQTQIFELVGDRAMWRDGWKAVARHIKGEDFDQDRWELFKLDEDFAELRNRADDHPALLRELIALWWAEAEKFGVLPLDDREGERAFEWLRNNPRSRYEYRPGMARVDRQLTPPVTDRGYRIAAFFNASPVASSGPILVWGSRFGGCSLRAENGEIVFHYACTETSGHTLRCRLGADTRCMEVRVERIAKGRANLSLASDGIARCSVLDVRTWGTFGLSSGLTCGWSNVTVPGVIDRSNDFVGPLDKVVVTLDAQADEPAPEQGEAAYRAVAAEQ